MSLTRIDLKAILADPAARRRLLIGCIIAIQAREGIVTTPAQAALAYDRALSAAAPAA
jgi:hypothetical protein